MIPKIAPIGLFRTVGMLASGVALSGCISPSPAAPPDAGTLKNAQSAAGASNRFAFHLLPLLLQEKPKENVFYSPTSLSMALSLAATGAKGGTQRAIHSALGFAAGSAADEENQALQQVLLQTDAKVTLNVANAVWADHDFAFQPDYIERAEKFYRADARTVNMREAGAADAINGWVAKETANKITRLVTPDAIRDASAVLTNAVYFNGKWTTPFDKARTRQEPFTPTGGVAFDVPMMHQKERMGFLGEDPAYPFDAVRLGYGKGKWSLYAFLPNRGMTLDALAAKFTPENWATWRKQFGSREVELGLPRFKAEYEAAMKQPLESLGMSLAFSDNADFSPMFARGSHRIDEVLHKAVLEMDEEGTRAAAATGVIVGVSAVIRETRVTFDRPFLCVIVDEESGAIVFMGAIRRPQELK